MSEDKMNTQPKHVDYNDLPIDLQKKVFVIQYVIKKK